MNWTQSDIDSAKRKMSERGSTIKDSLQVQARASRCAFHKSGEMNKTEAAYAAHLETLKTAGHVSDYRFESLKLRLADKTFYTPDFAVIFPNGNFELHEVKGFWEDDARVKIKVAAAQFPFKFIAVKKLKNGWQREEF